MKIPCPLSILENVGGALAAPLLWTSNLLRGERAPYVRPRIFTPSGRRVGLPLSLSHVALGLTLAALLPISTRAVTATGLSSFEGIEEPTVRYQPATGKFIHDDFVNITDVGERTFRMFLRYHSDLWDADRDTKNKDRERAEVKGLGRHQKSSETFEYATTWRTNPEFQGSGRFCHIFQLKSTNGDSGMPLITLSILEGRQKAALQYASGAEKKAVTAREFDWTPGKWQTVRIRIKTSETNDGEVLASIDGDEFQGARGVTVNRTEANDYRPKWGLYRGVIPGLPIGEDYVEHRNVSAQPVGGIDDREQIQLETNAREKARTSPKEALMWLQTQQPSPTRDVALSAIATRWAESQPVAAIAWVETLSPESPRADALLHVFNRWADADAGAALNWIKARAPAPELDPLLWYYTTDSTLRYVDREKALAALPLIADPELRAKAIDHVVLIWARSESAAAARYIEASAALDEKHKTAILKKITALH